MVACQADETAAEGAYPPGQFAHGAFTHSLLKVLGEKDAVERANLRWADIWSQLLANTVESTAQLRQRRQHPCLIGRSERRVFGGAWEKMDLGYRVTSLPDGEYEIGAGTLMGVTEGAEIAVYGAEPNLFPPLDSPENQPVGHLTVREAGLSSPRAVPTGPGFALPDGARGRLVKPGTSGRLRVSLKPEDAALAAQLETSPLLEIVPPATADADVEVLAQAGGGWIIGNNVEPLLAVVPAGEHRALRAGLEHYYLHNTVLRMADKCSTTGLSNCLSVRLLDCNDKAALNAMSPQQQADPHLPEAPRDQDGVYALPSGYQFCVRVTNSSPYALNVTLLGCTSGGKVEYLSDVELRSDAEHVMWLDNELGVSFMASPGTMPPAVPGVAVPHYVTDRLIVIGTTNMAVSLKNLNLDKTVQEVVDENRTTRGDDRDSRRQPKKEQVAPAELWTATVTPVRIAKQ